jgi:hypothetical protein
MAKLLVLLVFVIGTAHALEYNVYQSASGKRAEKISHGEFVRVWDGGAACLKNGAKLVRTSRKFGALNLGYGDCSKGAKTTERHKLFGYSVAVFDTSEIQPETARALGLIK